VCGSADTSPVIVPPVLSALETKRPALSLRHGRTLWATVWLTVLSSAPFVQLSIRVQHVELDANTWPYVYPYFGVAVGGLAMFVHDVWRGSRQTEVLARAALCAPLAIWLLASVGWGNSDYLAPREIALIVILLPGAWWFGGALRIGEQVVALFLATHVLVAASLVAIAVAPGTSTGRGFWNGVFANRNSLGPVAGVGALTVPVLIWLLRRPIWSAPGAVVVAVDLLTLARSGSDTAWFALAAAALTAIAVLVIWRLQRLGVPASAVAMGSAVLAVVGWIALFAFIGPITRAFGKDPTLSNRRVVWQYLREVTAGRRWTGFGYASFWDDPNLVYPLYLRTSTIYDSAHSTLMEMYVSLGIPGAAFTVLIAAGALAALAVLVWSGDRVSALTWAIVLAFVIVENLTESLIAYHSFLWSLLVAATFAGVGAGERPTTPTPNDSPIDRA
jgi:exopolysaccharide production protein ExoQ